MTTMISPATIVESAPILGASPEPSPRPAKGFSVPGAVTLAGPDSPATDRASVPIGKASRGSDVPGPAATGSAPTNEETLLDPALCLAADVLDDLERVRIANENRVRQLTRSTVDSDGEERGFGLDPHHPDVIRLVAMVDALKKLEHEATLELQRRMRRHPLGAWVKAQRGVGEKQAARLLAAIGDPYINSAKGAPRTVSALWAYSGLHVLPGGHPARDALLAAAAGDQHRDTDQHENGSLAGFVGVAAKRRKGERANWSTKAKMRAYLIAESCIKQLHPDCRDGHVPSAPRGTGAVPAQTPQDHTGPIPPDTQDGPAGVACGCSPYRVVYDQRRAHTAVTHPDWSDGHSHNDALRVASKAILRDLWRAARDYHLKEQM